MQKRTISIKLRTTPQESAILRELQKEFVNACNKIVPIAADNSCWNRIELHHLVYYPIRRATSLGAQMTCNAIRAVSTAFQTLRAKKTGEKPSLPKFKPNSAVHFDKRTYLIIGETISLYTLSGRLLLPMILGRFQREFLQRGVPKEAELIFRNNTWFFNLVLDVPTPEPVSSGQVLGVDLGENVLAATSSGKLFDGKQLRHERDRAVALRDRLQSNGSESAKQRLRKISGKEARRISHVNHIISKALVKEAIDTGCGVIALERLTNIRDRIKAQKRIRFRLHGWAWSQLQQFVVYKAKAAGLKVVFVNPAYTSQTCAQCKKLGIRDKHRFVCKSCGIQRHSDLNASQNLRRIAASADAVTGTVDFPNVGVA